MNIPTAAEARKKILDGDYPAATKQKILIENLINSTINQGLKTISGEGILLPPIVAALQAKGYKVSNNSQRNECYYTISFAE